MTEWTDEEEFQRYVEDLKLKPEDFEKKILDVGAGAAQFAKWAKEHGISRQIYSLEPQRDYLQESYKGVAGKAEELPFKDGSFDLAVSSAAIPNIYIDENDQDKVKEKITKSLSEILRVIRPGGEARLARVLMGKEYEGQRILSESVEEVLEELEATGGVQIEKIRTPANDTYEYEGKRPVKLLAEAYLIIIRKDEK